MSPKQPEVLNREGVKSAAVDSECESSSSSNIGAWPRPEGVNPSNGTGFLMSPKQCPLLTGSAWQVEQQFKSLPGDLKRLPVLLSRNYPNWRLSLEQLLDWLPRKMLRHHSPQRWTAKVYAELCRLELSL